MAMVTGVMAVGRYFAGASVHRLNAYGVLLYSAIVTTLGIYLMSTATGSMVYLSALIFALGVTYFWPTMIGFVAENIPQTGALGMSIMGGAGMFAVSIWNPIIGNWIDQARQQAKAVSTEPELIELAAGQATLQNLSIFPLVLIFAFTGLALYMRKQQAKPMCEKVS